MSAAWVWTSAVFFSFLNLHNAVAQSQMCNEPFQAVNTLVTNVTFPVSAPFLDSDLVFYRKVLRFTEEEIDLSSVRIRTHTKTTKATVSRLAAATSRKMTAETKSRLKIYVTNFGVFTYI